MRTAFSSHSEVCHVWAQRSQPEGRATNVFFHDDTIYSYGHHFPMAQFRDAKTGEVCLVTTSSYSVSTAKHIGHVYGALGYGDNRRCPVLNVPDVTAEFVSKHLYNVDALVNSAAHAAERASKRIGGSWQSPRDAAGHDLAAVEKCKATALAYRAAFLTWREVGKARRRKIESIGLTPEQSAKLDRAEQRYQDRERFKAEHPEEYEAKRRKANASRTRSQRRALSRQIRESIAGTRSLPWNAQVPYQCRRKITALAAAARERIAAMNRRDRMKAFFAGELSTVLLPRSLALLRIRGKRVETTQGAAVTTRAARALYLAIRAGKDVAGWQIDSFRVDRFNGDLNIGCHRIPRSEVTRIGRKLVAA